MHNLSIKFGHCNGTRYIIESLSDHLIHAKKLNGGLNDHIIIPKIQLYSKDTDFHAVFKRKQFPVMLAYYLTFHRAQGQSLEYCGMDLPKSPFSHGQLYVGASRSGDPNKTFIYMDQKEFENQSQDIRDHGNLIRNVVYHEVFHDNV